MIGIKISFFFANMSKNINILRRITFFEITIKNRVLPHISIPTSVPLLAYIWCSQLQSDIFIGKFDIFKHNRTQNDLSFEQQLCWIQSLEKINLAKTWN